MKRLFCGKNTGPVVVDIPDELIAEGLVCLDRKGTIGVRKGVGIVPLPTLCEDKILTPKPMTREQWRVALSG